MRNMTGCEFQASGVTAARPRQRQEAATFAPGLRRENRATDLEALRELAQQRGYKRGWAERVYQARLAKRHGI
jgi:hypothetical protein